jgi:hypothetical protein
VDGRLPRLYWPLALVSIVPKGLQLKIHKVVQDFAAGDLCYWSNCRRPIALRSDSWRPIGNIRGGLFVDSIARGLLALQIIPVPNGESIFRIEKKLFVAGAL